MIIPLVITLTLFSTTPTVAQIDPVQTVRTFERAKSDLSDVREKQQERIQQINKVQENSLMSFDSIQDERRRQKLENLAERFMNVKAKWVTHWTKNLERLSILLSKIESRGETLDSTETEFALKVREAESAIDTAIANLHLLSDKEYSFVINDEENLGQNIKTSIDELKTDLKAVREDVFEAKTKVKEAFQVLKAQTSTDDDDTTETNEEI